MSLHGGRTQGAHSHSHGHGHAHDIPRTSDNGATMMAFMAHMGQFVDIEHWLNDYRSRRFVPISNTALAVAAAVLIGGVGLSIYAPAGVNIIGWIAATLAGLYLGVFIVGGALLFSFMQRRRAEMRAVVLGAIPWQGDEQILDVGTGTGFLLNAVAGKLTTGHAIGIDLWQQAIGGNAEILQKNARAEGVSDKIETQEMDARALTFKDARFDVVVTSMALHHIATSRAECETAVSEITRVLRPGGYAAVMDIGPMIDLAEPTLRDKGLEIVRDTRASFFRIVVARKP